MVKTWLWRGMLVAVAAAAAYAALAPQLRAWYLVPHDYLYRHGISYRSVLWLETHMGSGLHVVAAFVLLLLLPPSRVLPAETARGQRWQAAGLLAAAGVFVELWQWGFTARGFGLDDLAFQGLGMAAGAVVWWLASGVPEAGEEPTGAPGAAAPPQSG